MVAALLVAVALPLALVEPPLLARQQAVGACGTPARSAFAPADVLGRRAVLSAAAATALSAFPAASFAESTLVTRQQAYTRYVPRIERGRDFWGGKLKRDIASGDWASIAKELEPIGKKDKGGAIKKFLGPMGLWASSFSSKTISDKTTAMLAAIDELNEAVETLEIAANGKEKDAGIFGFFGAQKTMDDKSRSALALAAYKKGKNAFNKYIEIGNDGLGINFTALDTID